MKFFFLSITVLLSTAIHAQQITTFILVRHAEKMDASKDPDLSELGRQRALRLASLLRKTSIDVIYSTSFKRTMTTVTPLAKEKGLEVNTYEPLKADAIEQMLKKFPGGTIVVCGHSNTIPWTANYLTGKESFKNFDDSEYGNVLIVEVMDKEKGKVLWLEY
ncbi:MAG TPA: phosphoglycerate mutase family protein [Cyclobacteriaceae bacterium]|nr:phosphoglycerate mutase family protein [Cyclobacteriaceae bacterium]